MKKIGIGIALLILSLTSCVREYHTRGYYHHRGYGYHHHRGDSDRGYAHY